MVDDEADSPVSVCSSPNWVIVVLFVIWPQLWAYSPILPANDFDHAAVEDHAIWEEVGRGLPESVSLCYLLMDMTEKRFTQWPLPAILSI